MLQIDAMFQVHVILCLPYLICVAVALIRRQAARLNGVFLMCLLLWWIVLIADSLFVTRGDGSTLPKASWMHLSALCVSNTLGLVGVLLCLPDLGMTPKRNGACIRPGWSMIAVCVLVIIACWLLAILPSLSS